VDRKFLADAFLKKTTRWDDGELIRPVDQVPDSPVRRKFSEDVVKRSVAAVRSYWQQVIFTGRGVPPPEVGGDDEVVRYVLKYSGAVGYVSEAQRRRGEGDSRSNRLSRMRLTFRAKLIAIVGATAFALLLFIVVGAVTAARVRGQLAAIQERYIPKVELAPQLEGQFDLLRRDLQDAVAARDGDALDATRDIKKGLVDRIVAARDLIAPPTPRRSAALSTTTTRPPSIFRGA